MSSGAPRRRVDPGQGRAAVDAWMTVADHAGVVAEGAVARPVLATAVRFTLEELAATHPGRAVEVRVPPFGAVQCMAGTTHRRGTPPAVVQAPADVWLALATGRLAWAEAIASSLVDASGERSDLSTLLPLGRWSD